MKATKSKSNKSLKWKIIVIVISVLVLIRVTLPLTLKYFANRTLAGMHGYFGHVRYINISLFRGAYILNDFYINKIDSTSQSQVPFISSEKVDLSIEWKSLLHKRLVGELKFLNPLIVFTRNKVEPGDVQKDTSDFSRVLNKFMPLKINHLEIDNGKIQYIDSSSKPVVNIFLDNSYVLAQNLSSVEDTSLLPATIIAKANLYGGDLDFKMRMDPMAKYPAFEMSSELKNTNLPRLNDFFKAYANVDVSKGSFGLYTEMASKDDKFIGYIKPIIKDLEVIGPEDRHDSFLNKLWEGIIATTAVVLTNQDKDQIATKIPIEGVFGDVTMGKWSAIVGLFRNAFVKAIYPAIDHQISLFSINKVKANGKKNLIQKIFGKPDKKQEVDTKNSKK